MFDSIRERYWNWRVRATVERMKRADDLHKILDDDGLIASEDEQIFTIRREKEWGRLAKQVSRRNAIRYARIEAGH